MICKCPAATSIATVPNMTCPETFGQIQKVAFQRLYTDAGARNCFEGTPDGKDIKKLAAWTPLLAAVDSTKVAMSPYIQAPTAEGGAPRTFGGGNETLGRS